MADQTGDGPWPPLDYLASRVGRWERGGPGSSLKADRRWSRCRPRAGVILGGVLGWRPEESRLTLRAACVDAMGARRCRLRLMDSRQPITVAIARFDDLVALGLRALLADESSVSVIAHDIPYDRLAVMLRTHRPQVVILDPGKLDRLAEVRELSVLHTQTRLVALGDGLTSIEAAQLLAFGASACLPRDTQGRDVLNAIHLASRGLQLMPLGPPDAHGAQVRDSSLTPREADVLLLLRQDLSNAQIALELHIGIETVRSHARSVYRKLGVRSRRDLMALASPPAPTPTRDDTRHPPHRRTSTRSERRQPHA